MEEIYKGNRFVRLLESWQWAQHCNEFEYIKMIEKELLDIYNVNMEKDAEKMLVQYKLI